MNRNRYGQDTQRSKHLILNCLAQNGLEVVCVLMNSGFISIDEQLGCDYFGDFTLRIPDINKFEAWLVRYGSFFLDHHHRPQQMMNYDINHHSFRDPQERYLAVYYNRQRTVIWTSTCRSHVEEMILESLGPLDYFNQIIAPKFICQHSLQRFIGRMKWVNHSNH